MDMRRILWSLIGCLFLGLIGTASVLGWQFYHKLEHAAVQRFSDHRWAVPSKVYARPLLLYPGLKVEEAALFDHLARLDYQQVEHPIRARGDYWRNAQSGEVQIFLRESTYPGRERSARRILLSIQQGRIERLTDLDDQTVIQAIETEPEVITRFYAQAWEERRVVKLYEVPSLLVKAVLAAEDHRFFEHRGVDWRRILGAARANIIAGGTVQGGSTLTQQLIKNFFLSQERTIKRKLTEVCLALIIENHYSKLQILENYLNEIYLGQRGAKSILGIWEAARFYFGKAPRDLTLGEMAIIAGMIKAPNRYAPNRHPERAILRRNHILQRMVVLGTITEEEADAARHEEAGPRQMPPEKNKAPYFVDFIRKELEASYPAGTLTKAGLNIFTVLDMRLQQIAREVIQTGLAELEEKHPQLKREIPEERLQACLVAIQPQTGHILALVGGRDYQVSQFNRTVQARRQLGSIFKPVVFLAALEKERQQRDGRFLPTSLVNDAPFSWFYEDKEWSPRNYKNRYRGMVSLRKALEKSSNAATARIAQEVGLEPARQMAVRLGFTSPLPAYPSLALGAAEVTPLEVAFAYSTLANQGIATQPETIHWITSRTGEIIEQHQMTVEQRIHPDEAYVLTHLLEGVMKQGTGAGARRRGFVRPAAGKTGTTNDYGDAWFVGYTPDLLTVVWVGFDRRASLDLSGAQAALPIWTAFMKRATVGMPVADFSSPPGVTLVAIDQQTGLRATPHCPKVMQEAFPKGREPILSCPYHTSGSTPPRPPVRTTSADHQSPAPELPAGELSMVLSESLHPVSVNTPSPQPSRSKPWWNIL